MRSISCLVSGYLCLSGLVAGQTEPSTIYGIHDDSPASVSEWTSRCPSGISWITATEGLGANPADISGKTYSVTSGSKVIARLNYGYFPNGTIPLASQYGN